MRLRRASQKLKIDISNLDEDLVELAFSSQRKAELYNRLKAIKLLSAAAKSAGFDSPKKLLDFLKSYKS